MHADSYHDCVPADAPNHDRAIEDRLASVWSGDSDDMIAAMRACPIVAELVQDIVRNIHDRLFFANRAPVLNLDNLDELRGLAVRIDAAMLDCVERSFTERTPWSAVADRRAQA